MVEGVGLFFRIDPRPIGGLSEKQQTGIFQACTPILSIPEVRRLLVPSEYGVHLLTDPCQLRKEDKGG